MADRRLSARELLKLLRGLRRSEEALTQRRHRAIAGLQEHLEPREMVVLAHRYGALGPPRSIAWVGETLKVSKARAAQIERRAMQRLELRTNHPLREQREQRAILAADGPELEQLRKRLRKMIARHEQSAPSVSARLARNHRRQALERRIAELEHGPKGDTK